MLGYLIVGVITGVVSLVGMLVLGRSVVTALLAYMAIGSATTLLLPMFAYALHRIRARSDEDDEADRNDDVSVGQTALAIAPTASIEVATVGQLLFAGLPTMSAAQALKAVEADTPPAILAVDDDAFILELIPKLAAQVDYPNVVTAASAEEAIVLLERTTTAFKCILLDIQMPGMNGVELCERIRGMDMYRGTPIVMLTAKSEHSYLDRAFKAGATDYITKPFDVTDFAGRLKAMIEVPAVEVEKATSRVAPTKVFGEQKASPRSVPSTAFGVVHSIASGNFIDLNALSNYLTRLSGAALVRSVVVAVEVKVNPEVQKSLTSNRFRRLLEEAASSIDGLLGSQQYVGAYVGHGQFVLICNRDAGDDFAKMEADLQVKLDHRLEDETVGRAPFVSVLVGATVRPRTLRLNRARDAIGTALDLVDARAGQARGVLPPKLHSVRKKVST